MIMIHNYPVPVAIQTVGYEIPLFRLGFLLLYRLRYNIGLCRELGMYQHSISYYTVKASQKQEEKHPLTYPVLVSRTCKLSYITICIIYSLAYWYIYIYNMYMICNMYNII